MCGGEEEEEDCVTVSIEDKKMSSEITNEGMRFGFRMRRKKKREMKDSFGKE